MSNSQENVMPDSGVFVRYSDFQKNVPYRLILNDVEQNLFYRHSFLKFNAFFVLDDNKKEFVVIFPKYQFRKEYLKYPTEVRKRIGNKLVFIEIYKRDGGVLEITKLRKYMPKYKKRCK